jgi:hypothetical protein
MYEILELPEPLGRPAVRPLPSLIAEIPEPDAFDVVVKSVDHQDNLAVLTLERHPSDRAKPADFDHLAVSEVVPDPDLLERAAVIWSSDPHDDLPSALLWTRETLACQRT